MKFIHGNKQGDMTFAPNTIFNEDGISIAEVFGIPTNCRLEEIKDEPKWQEGLKTLKRIVDTNNNYDELVEGFNLMFRVIKREGWFTPRMISDFEELLNRVTDYKFVHELKSI